MILQAIALFRKPSVICPNKAKAPSTSTHWDASESKNTSGYEYEIHHPMRGYDGFTIGIQDLIYVGTCECIGRIYKYTAASYCPSSHYVLGDISITGRGAVTQVWRAGNVLQIVQAF